MQPRPVGRPGAERGHPHRGRAGAGAHALRRRRRTGTSTATFASGEPQADASAPRSSAVDGGPAGHGQGLRRGRPAASGDVVVLDEAGGPRAGRRRSTAPPFAVRSVESQALHAASPTAPFMTSTLQQEAGRKLRLSARRGPCAWPSALRERLHHLHADRQHDAVGDRADRRPRRRSLEHYGAGLPARRSPGSTPRRSRTPRRPTRPSAPRATASASPRRSRASSAPTRSASTS